ncbi:MAG: sulfite exporter TauE/SafE family protein [candidate division Zixibacteria bacterium]|nr:sulfite exporter TauE/SafE family protein [candidate division Zixibacteria bacterium]
MLTIHLPIIGRDFSLTVLVTLGFCAGVLGGFFGVGGAWIVTPALNIFGINIAYAIGTDLAHIFGKSIIATKKHSRMGNVDWRLGLLSVIGSVIGMEAGRRMVLYLEHIGRVEGVVRWGYMLFLFGLGVFMLTDYITNLRRRNRPGHVSEGEMSHESAGTLARFLRKISLPPFLALPTSGISRISFWVIFLIFGLTGFFSGFMGVGGGFILLPALIYLIGCPTTVAVGTSLLSVCLMSAYGCFTYALAGRVEVIAAAIMLVSAAVGSQIGVLATRYVQGYGIRLLFSVMIILAGISVSLKQAYAEWQITLLETLSVYSVMGAAILITAFILIRLVLGIRKTGMTE